MSYHSHTAAEWAAFVSLGVGFWASCAALLYLTFDADLADFDPRRALARLVESGRVDALLLVVGPTLAASREAARDAAALVVLLTTRPKGAMA